MASDPIPNAKTSFAELMALEKVPGKECTYMSKVPAWPPGRSLNAYGGHVYAQACWAAAQEVKEGLVVHSTHGYFTLPGKIDCPFIYTVTPISDTRTTCQRSVSVRQPRLPSKRKKDAQFPISDADEEMGDVCFHMICSFKIASTSNFDHQVQDWAGKYEVALAGRQPVDFNNSPEIDMPWYTEYAKKFPQQLKFPGLEMRKADCEAYNAGKTAEDYRQLQYYRLIGEVSGREPNMHAAAHLYASDRNGLFLVANAVGFAYELVKVASLGHSVIFHTGADGMLMEGGAWWAQEAWTPRSGDGRGVQESKLWSPTGVHVATTLQDGLVRKAEPGTKAMFDVFKEVFTDGVVVGAENGMAGTNAAHREGPKL